MRVIKKRAWDAENNVMRFDTDLTYIASSTIMRLNPYHKEDFWECLDNSKDQYKIMQLTGVKDDRGGDIYEGDVIDCKLGFEGASLPHMGEVVYVDDWGCFATENEAGKTPFTQHQINTRKVIGNIYENPNLRIVTKKP